MDDSVIVEEFGQKIDLTRRIREVLVNYPEGTTILKELIQNADDAGASRVAFCLDRRQHGVESLLYKDMGGFQGPSLLCYNNAQFTDDDFESITRIGDSKKQSQASKTGRFGIGFNSVYHLSDLPSFVSGKYIVLFDPHCRYLPQISSANPGKRIDFVNSAALRHYEDQFRPYCAFGCNMKSLYPGTLFRLPLRTDEQAAVSRISKQSYSEENIMTLLHELYLEAVPAMLFLKNIEMLEIYDWNNNTEQPRVLFSCCLDSPTRAIRSHRQALSRISEAWSVYKGNGSHVPRYIETFRISFVSQSHTESPATEKKKSSYLIAQCMDSSASRVGLVASRALKEYDVQLLPWASVAADVSEDVLKAEEKSSDDGLAFCFLPLPVKTRLPVHVNGYFELSSNRRDIWYGLDMDRMGKLRSQWNTTLLEDVVSLAYCQLISAANKSLGPCYQLWPSGSFVRPWQNMVDQFYKNILKYPVFYSEIMGGKYVLPSDAILHDEHFADSDKLAFALIEEGLPIVRLPAVLMGMLLSHCPSALKIASPNMVRFYMKQPGKHMALSNRVLGLMLLDYCLSDIIDEEASEMLTGLPLIPLADGQFGVFKSRREDAVLYFVCSDLSCTVFDSVKDRLVDNSIPANCLDRITKIARISSTNIGILTCEEAAKLLGRILPVEWFQKVEVEWKPLTVKSHPEEGWIILLWQYLRECTDDLSAFENWPILPTNNGMLCKLMQNSKLIRGGFLNENLERIVASIGCRILVLEEKVDHPSLAKYVNPADGPGVLKAILAVSFSTGYSLWQLFSGVNSAQRRVLRAFLLDLKWFKQGQIDDSKLQGLRRLPMYEVFRGPGTKEKEFVDLSDVDRFLPPRGINEALLGPDFLCSLSQEETDTLQKVLKLKQMGKSAFYKHRVIDCFDRVPSEIRNVTVLTILKELSVLRLEDASIKDALRNTACIPTRKGGLFRPDSLYDPRIKEFNMLLNELESFPAEEFQEPEVLDTLLSIGLRTTISLETILESASQIEHLTDSEPEKAHFRGHILLSYLEANITKVIPYLYDDESMSIDRVFMKVVSAFQNQDSIAVSQNKFWNELSTISWCPVLLHPPHPRLPWPSVTSTVAPPKLIRLPSDIWLVSASMRILERECHSALLCKKLGWVASPNGKIVAAQLLELGKDHVVVDDRSLRQALATSIPRLYDILIELLGSIDMEIVKAILEGSRWVWVGDGFANVQEVMLSGPLHLTPYLRVIPADLTVYKELLMELGVKETLTPLEFSLVLAKMAGVKNGLPLESHELRAAIWILQHLVEMSFHHADLYIPDFNAVLSPFSELIYNDAPWLEVGEVQLSLGEHVGGSKMGRKFVHPNVSNDVAERLGVNSLRRSLLAESAASMNISLHGIAEAFGQHEALTTRLKHIVEMYADGPGLLFELVQNADDAGATEVSFLMDNSHFGTSSLLSPGMTEWQGPALYCFNNSIFTEKDLYSISRIGQDSKLEKPHAVGRFGLGFNCVYHFTDLPGFVSGENLVMFDPHARYLPGISPSHPGLKVKFVGRNMLEKFPDQCRPYLLFGCDLQNPFKGTLFRFPLRTSATAAQSQIKAEPYSLEMVQDLFSSFQAVASETLLFLRNVTTITIYSREGTAHDLQMLYKVQKQNIDTTETKRTAVYDFIRGNQLDPVDREYFYKKLQRTPEYQLPWHCGKVQTVMIGGGVEETNNWIISDTLGGGGAKSMAIMKENRDRGFVPWAGVAVQIDELKDDTIRARTESEDFQSLNSEKHVEGRAFCFLPLPVKTHLPVHVNGYFELSSNRRDIWYGNDMAGGGKLRSDWNRHVLQDAAAPAYARLLAKAATDTGSAGDEYYSLWPTGSIPEPWAALMQGVYLAVTDLELPVLYTTARGGQWISAKQGVFPDFNFPDAIILCKVLADSGIALVNPPEAVVVKFREFCPSLRFLTPHLLRSSLARRSRTFGDLAAALVVLKYCLYDINRTEAVHKVKGLPLIPLQTGSFGTFTDPDPRRKLYVASESGYSLLKDRLPEVLVNISGDVDLSERITMIAESKSTNLTILTCEDLKELLPRLLPSEWYRKEVVNWTPGIEGHPNQAWISILWNFLATSASGLSLFSDWPLLPLSNGHLSRLRKNSNVLRNDSWSENMVTLLQKANCFILASTVALNHPDLDDHVQSASATGVLNALLAASDGQISRIPELFKEALECEIHELRTFLLQMKWFSETKMDSIHLEVLGALPIFESFGKPKFVNLRNHKRFLAPEDVEKELLDDEFIRPSSEKEEAILKRFMGLIKLGKQNFYEQHAFKKLHKVPANRRKEIMINLFGDLQLLMKESPSIISTLSQTSFVWTTEGSLEVPGRLYDPRVSELQLLLNEKVFFPAEDFRAELILDVLAELGLKKLLDRDGLLDCARSVAMLRETNENEAMEMGQALLLQLNSLGQRDGAMRKQPESDGNTAEEVELSVAGVQTDCLLLETDRESFEEFWVQLATISWCPVYVNPPVPDLPWQNHLKGKVASPKAARPKSQMWLVSASMRILDGDCSTMLIDRLGWSEKPSANVLALQLIELSKTYQHIKNNAVELLEKIEHLELIYQKEIPSLYKLMQEFVDTEDLQILQTMLDKKLWVWMGGGFVQSKDVAFDSPAHFQPYLHIVPTELACFKSLFTALGVRTSFDVNDYISVVHRVASDARGEALSPELLGFVLRVLEAVSENVLAEGQHGDKVSLESILLPDAMGVLVLARDLVYNDAPWLTKSSAGMGETLRFVHTDVQNELAEKLGAKSLRYLTLVDKEMTRDLPCLATEDIAKLLKDFGNESYLLFDLLEVADCCKARRVLVVHDKREHSQISTMQPTLGQFQGQALTIAFLGAELTTEEVCTLQTSAACKLRGFNKGYGSGLISSYSVTDLPMLVSGGCLYMFDPSGLVLPTSVSKGKRSSTGYPVGKVYAFQGTDLAHRFADQFQPFFINQNLNWATKNVTLIRLPLRKQILHDDSYEEEGHGVVEGIFESFVKHASGALLFLNSVEEVCLSTWEQGETSFENFLTVKIDPSSAILRNPFEEKKWRKFQISNIFGVPSMATKVHVIDILIKGKEQCFLDKWLIVLSLGSGQTKNMALDRRYLSYNLTPIAGVAAHISRNGSRANLMSECCILSPLPLSWVSGLPVIILGHFMVSHNTIRHLFHDTGMMEIPKTATSMPTIQQSKLPISSIWNKELMACVRDAYLELLLQLPRVPQDTPVKRLDAKAPMFRASQMSVEHSYSYWPISQKLMEHRVGAPTDDIVRYSSVDRGCLSELLAKPLYSRLAELPVWQLHGGEMVKSTEGMFLSNPRAEQDHFSPPVTVREYLKQHFKVFAVPWELMRGLELSGVEIKVITPKMVRNLVKASFKPSPFFSVESFIDLLEYCCMDSPICEFSQISGRSDTANGSRDIQSTTNATKIAHTLGESSNSQISRLPTLMSSRTGLQSLNQELQGLANTPLNIVTNIGRASLGKALIKDLDRESGDRVSSGVVSAEQRYETWLSELQGLPCPTATEQMAMLGDKEFWIGNREQQMLMEPLKSRFVHIGCLERPLLLKLFSDHKFQRQLKVKPFSMQVLSGNINVVIPRNWIARTSSGEATPWVLWHESDTLSYGAPSSEWLRTFWKYVNPFSSQEISEFAIWPLVPAVLTASVLVKVRNKELVFIPPIAENLAKYSADRGEVQEASLGSPVSFEVPEHVTEALQKADVDIQTQYPWMYLFLQSCNIPLYNQSYFNCSAVFTCLQFNRERTLGQIVTSKILAAQQSGHFHTSSLILSPEVSDGFFSLLASDFSSANSNTSFYSTDELHLLRSLPIYKTSTGLYTAIDRETNCIVPTQAFFQPKSDLCLMYLQPDQGGSLYHILGVSELTNQEILLRFGLPGYMEKDDLEKECILSYIYRNWGNLQHENSVLAAIKETRFVRSNSVSIDGQLYQPLDLLDPDDTLLSRVYADDASKFPASQFTDERWLQILRKTGLRSSRDADLILECARKVESKGRGNAQIIDDASHLLIKHLADNDGVSTEILLLAEAVVKTILENFATFYSSSFCDSLSHIAIIPAERGIPNSGGRGSRKVLASFRDVVLMKDWPLAWTCSPILSKSNLIPPEFSWGFLHLRTPPPFSTVLQHLEVAGKNSGEDILARWPTSEGTKSVEEAFADVLNYLSAKWNNLSDREKRALKSLPFIPIANGTRLSAASSLYVRLGINLAPFAFELPNVYLRHVKVLTDLGMRESPSLDSMRSLLLEIQDTIGYRRLNPNELRAVFQILQLMCEEAKIGNSDENVHEKLVEDAVIPDDTGRLVRAQACVYVDALAAGLVSKINSSLVRFAHPCFPEKLCVQLGVQKLSDVVVEVIHKDCSLETVEVLGSVSRRFVVNKLQSKSFQDATFAIVRSFSQQIPSLKFWTKVNIEKCLNSGVEGLQFVRYLYTQLLMIPRNVDVTREASKSHHTENHSKKIISGLEVYAFVDQSKSRLIVAEPPGSVSLSDLLAVVISRLLDSPVCLPLSSLFNSPSGSEMDVIDVLRLPIQHDSDQGRFSSGLQQIAPPGQEIPMFVASQAQNHPLRPFYAGEIVAWRPDANYASRLRYGIVSEDVRPLSGQALYRLMVESAPGEFQYMLSSNVFSFKTESSQDSVGPFTDAEMNSETTLDSLPVSGQETDGMASKLEKQAKSAKASTKEVPASEVVGVITDMLAAVGLPLDIESQSLLHQTLRLQEQLTASQTALLLEQERAEGAIKEAESAKTAWSCRVCLGFEVDTILEPCGHMLCGRCCAAVNRCPFCRRSVSKALRMYRP